MMSIDQLQNFFAFCTVINIGIFAFSAIMLLLFKNRISEIHAKMFGINKDNLTIQYFKYLSHYKIAIIVFNLVPYLALSLL